MSRVAQILSEAQERLDTAKVGFEQAKLGSYHVRAGFRNVAIYGKMVTFCTNNLRGKVDGFEEWDAAAKQTYFDNDVARVMTDARNQFEKQASNPIFSSTHIKSFSPQDLAKISKPANATGFFIGDRMGGSGWMLQMKNGDKLPFYIDLPPEIGEVKTVLPHGEKTLDLMEVAEQYLDSLQAYLDELRAFVADKSDK
jgi:hypothetical protein